jgi:hypothetical protein
MSYLVIFIKSSCPVVVSGDHRDVRAFSRLYPFSCQCFEAVCAAQASVEAVRRLFASSSDLAQWVVTTSEGLRDTCESLDTWITVHIFSNPAIQVIVAWVQCWIIVDRICLPFQKFSELLCWISEWWLRSRGPLESLRRHGSLRCQWCPYRMCLHDFEIWEPWNLQ